MYLPLVANLSLGSSFVIFALQLPLYSSAARKDQ